MSIQEIQKIEFGFMSPREIMKLSVVEIHKNKISNTGGDNKSKNSLYDPRMGPMKYGCECVTCHKKTKDCVGHFGHIALQTPIIHPLYYKQILSFLRCFCFKCSRLLFTADHVDMFDLSTTHPEEKFDRILEKIVKQKFCMYCAISQPRYTFSSNEGFFYAFYKSQQQQQKRVVPTDEIYRILSNIETEDIKILGFDPSRMSPKYFILTVLPVLPPRSRPYIMTDSMICDDDLTLCYSEIIKANNQLRKPDLSETKRQKSLGNLVFRIKTLFDNSSGKAKHTNSRAIKGMKERLCGRDGLIRNNLMGKRVNFSARTVIGPDPTLCLNEIAVPPKICDILTHPIRIFKHNRKKMQKMVWDNEVNVIERGNRRIHVCFALKGKFKNRCKLEIGDIAHTKVQTGDRVLLNRQPTLHKGSMLAMKVIRREGKSIRLNLAITDSFNGDFDGDEMNIHTYSSEMSRAELEGISAVEHNMIGAQSSKSVIKIVQDALLSCYLMTSDDTSIPKDEYFQLLMSVRNLSFQDIEQHLEDTLREKNETTPLYCGKTLFSVLLPRDFNYKKGDVLIRKGVLVNGAITKTQLKSGHSTLMVFLCKEYSDQICLEFVNNVQFLGNAYMLYRGFSVGIEDCLSDSAEQIQSFVSKCFLEASTYQESTFNESIKEAKINMALSKAKDVGMRIAKESLKKNNNFISTVTSGSKGDYFNIAQIMGLLGQQNITGARVEQHLINGRTLPHYPIGELSTEMSYESRGFIRNSFLKGLNPKEFWFHAMSGREGITDTAMKTAQSGYIQRKMVKIMEDVQVKYDKTVRNSTDWIIQFAYGNDNLCATQTVLKHGTPTVVDVQRLAEQLNAQHEMGI